MISIFAIVHSKVNLEQVQQQLLVEMSALFDSHYYGSDPLRQDACCAPKGIALED